MTGNSCGCNFCAHGLGSADFLSASASERRSLAQRIASTSRLLLQLGHRRLPQPSSCIASIDTTADFAMNALRCLRAVAVARPATLLKPSMAQQYDRPHLHLHLHTHPP